MSDNFDRYTEMFLEEASEQVEDLNQNLLTLEKEGYDSEIINEIFRIAHTMKSSAAFVGLDHLSDLAHHMEDLLQYVKDETIEVSTDLITLFFQCLDRIKVAVGEVSHGRVPDDTFQDLLESLRLHAPHQSTPTPAAPKLQPKQSTPTQAAAPSPPVAAAPAPSSTGSSDEISIPLTPQEEQELKRLAGKQSIYDCLVSLDPESPMKNMRFLLLVQHLNKAGFLYRSLPESTELEGREQQESEFRFIFVGDVTQEALSQICQKIDMIEEVRIIGHGGAGRVVTKKGSQVSSGGDGEETRLKTKNIKVSSEKIDYLLNSVGELVITNSGLQKIYEDLQAEFGEGGALAELKSKIDQAARIARDLQSGIMKTRMIPVGLVFHRYTRPVRDLALELGKEVDLVFQGEETELDKNIIDALNDPMLHLIRNSMDHGIESSAERTKQGKPERAKLLLNAYQSGNNIYVEIRDDGRGMNKDAILRKAIQKGLVNEDTPLSDDDIYNLIFAPGFSTAEQVTDVSGRGVGMNVVRRMVQEFKGSIQVQNEPGQGCSFILSFPLTLAIISAILVKVNGEEYAFPLSDVVETIKVSQDDITTLQGKDIFNLRGDILPVFNLGVLMGSGKKEYGEEFPVVIANSGNRKIGFIVDSMVGKKEIVIKSLEQNFRSVNGLIGACLMGDGSIVMVLDVQGMLELATGEGSNELARAGQQKATRATHNYNVQVSRIKAKKSGQGGSQENESDSEEEGELLDIDESEDTIRAEAEAQREKQRKLLDQQKGQKLAAETVAAAKESESTTTPSSAPSVKASPPPAATLPAAAKPAASAAPAATAVAAKAEPLVARESRPAAVSTLPESRPEPETIIIDEDDQPPLAVTPPAPPAKKESPNGSGAQIDWNSSSAFRPGQSQSNTAPAPVDDDDERVSKALTSFQLEKEERIARAQKIIKSDEVLRGRSEPSDDLTDADYNKLYAVINTGMINAGFVLSQLLGVKVEVSVPEFKTIPVSQLGEYIPADSIIQVSLETAGDFKALISLVFDETNGYRAAGDLMGIPQEQWNRNDISRDDVQSVLSELSNIVGSSILNALANKSGLSITPSVPIFYHGKADDLLNEYQQVSGGDPHFKVIYISADFYRDEMELLGRLFLLPSRPTLGQLVSRL